jgi:hypothetical protein
LVIWDIENIHFYDDFSIITRYVKEENQLRVVSYSNKFENYIRTEKLDFELNKLKKRKWIIKETKKIADDTLYEVFNKYKDRIKELKIITNDSDFNLMLKEANKLGIKTTVLHRNGRDRKGHWYDKANEVLDLRDI